VARDSQEAFKATSPQLRVHLTRQVKACFVDFGKTPCVDIGGVKDETWENPFEGRKRGLDTPSTAVGLSENHLQASLVSKSLRVVDEILLSAGTDGHESLQSHRF